MNNDKLKNCPFCDGIARLSSTHVDTILEDNAERFYVVCNSCACQGGWAKTPGNAVRNWNMRISDANDT